jgi:hypothetical protein
MVQQDGYPVARGEASERGIERGDGLVVGAEDREPAAAEEVLVEDLGRARRRGEEAREAPAAVLGHEVHEPLPRLVRAEEREPAAATDEEAPLGLGYVAPAAVHGHVSELEPGQPGVIVAGGASRYGEQKKY